MLSYLSAQKRRGSCMRNGGKLARILVFNWASGARRIRVLAAAYGMVAVVSACSPYIYKDEIGGISSAIGSINSSWKAGQEALVDDHSVTTLEYASWRGVPVTLSGPCVTHSGRPDAHHQAQPLLSQADAERHAVRNRRRGHSGTSPACPTRHDEPDRADNDSVIDLR